MFEYLISSVCNMISNLFNWKTKETEHQLETLVIKDKKNYQKAIDYAEKIITISDKYKYLIQSLQQQGPLGTMY